MQYLVNLILSSPSFETYIYYNRKAQTETFKERGMSLFSVLRVHAEETRFGRGWCGANDESFCMNLSRFRPILKMHCWNPQPFNVSFEWIYLRRTFKKVLVLIRQLSFICSDDESGNSNIRLTTVLTIALTKHCIFSHLLMTTLYAHLKLSAVHVIRMCLFVRIFVLNSFHWRIIEITATKSDENNPRHKVIPTSNCVPAVHFSD